MITFKEPHIDITEMLKPGAVVPLEFKFDGDPNEIKTISPSCGCTADCKKVGNKIVATFTENGAATVDKNNFPTGIYTFKKTINVFMTDKTSEKLTFSGSVKL